MSTALIAYPQGTLKLLVSCAFLVEYLSIVDQQRYRSSLSSVFPSMRQWAIFNGTLFSIKSPALALQAMNKGYIRDVFYDLVPFFDYAFNITIASFKTANMSQTLLNLSRLLRLCNAVRNYYLQDSCSEALQMMIWMPLQCGLALLLHTLFTEGIASKALFRRRVVAQFVPYFCVRREDRDTK